MLPIAKYKDEIVKAVIENDIVILTAETGSGKSTQVPQYLAEIFQSVVVTEPRIMAAKTLAQRVADEMDVRVGIDVGYRTAYEKCALPTSKITYVTDGLQLVRTIFDENKENKNVLIIDEVHEWNLNIENLIAYCKFCKNEWNTKVVIMSATMESNKLAEYFGEGTAVVDVPGSLYDVQVEERPKEFLIDSILENVSLRKNVLVFVPGKREISNVIEELKGTNAVILPLHAEMDWEEQNLCFKSYPNSKVIVATNVAQTSLTIPDIDVVVDTGLARISIAEDGIQGLFLKDISQADILQRKGRAGRTKDGRYILCSDTPIDFRNEFSVPEIRRSILDRVVLQLAAVGLDAAELEFFHQPEIASIRAAKKELIVIGAMKSDNSATELGYKIAQMPVSVQLGRMIIEAEQYDVTEPVMTIAAIIEMGGLLSRDGYYDMFTTEQESDLLAELDVWNKIKKMPEIDFRRMGINKKNFFKIKDHIQKLREVLFGVVKMTKKNNREAILKSCLSGWVSNIYVRETDNRFYGDDGIARILDKRSCISNYNLSCDFLIGKPKTIEYEDEWEQTRSLNLVSFASIVDGKMLLELVPDSITTKTKIKYSANDDAVIEIEKQYFNDYIIDEQSRILENHPEYERLKREYEEEENHKYSSIKPDRQITVKIDGKDFKVDHFWGKPTIHVDDETLYTTKEKEVFLDNGKRVYLISFSYLSRREAATFLELKNAIEAVRISNLKKYKKREYETLKADTIEDVLKQKDYIGEIELTKDNGGYGNNPILTYGCISLKKNTISFNIIDDKEQAESNTLESLQYLFIKEIEKKYSDRMFYMEPGKKKRSLSKVEEERKKEFQSLVREILQIINLDNVIENLEFLEEFYHEIMKR